MRRLPVFLILTLALSSASALCAADSLYDVVEKAQLVINQKYPDESSIAKKMAMEKLEKIALSDKTDAEKIAAIQDKFPDQITLTIRSAERGDTDAQYKLGVCYSTGEGVKQDYAEAVKWFRKAAEQGHAEAQFKLGLAYEDGNGVAKDYTEAVKWFRKAAEQGHAEAIERLKTAEPFMNAQNGNAEAQFKLGHDYEFGDGVTKDYTEAAKWYRKAAEQGHAGAKAVLEGKNIELPSGTVISLVKVEAGTFEMSAKDGENSDGEVPHRATLTKDFYIGRTEVTQLQWKEVMGKNPSDSNGDDLPVQMVSWNDAMAFCAKLNEMGKVPTGWKFTLPTETQWEYAARGGNKSKGYKYSGSNDIDEVAWYGAMSGGNSQYKEPQVAQKKANELGLYDMSGNVAEWCLDNWEPDSSKLIAEFMRDNDSKDWDPDLVAGRIRGGSRVDGADYCRSASREEYDPSKKTYWIGFRLALVPAEGYGTKKQTAMTTSTEPPGGSTARTLVPADKTIDLSDNGKVKIEMMKVEAGTFVMSAKERDSFSGFRHDEREIPHQATLKQDFFIGRTEVTQAQWKEVMGKNPSSNRKGDTLPVESVSWNDAMEFCERLNEMGKAPTGWKFTLPTETQWEYAARGGNRSRSCTYSGSNDVNKVAWYNGGDRIYTKETHQVAQKKANELGLHDMSGNVWEWCLDDRQDDSSKLIAEFARENDRDDSEKAIRGGSTGDDASECRTAYRMFADPVYGIKYYGPSILDPGSRSTFRIGLRLVLVPEGEDSTARTIVPADKTVDISDDGKVKIEMMKVEAGTFVMSAKDGENYSSEVPHRATLTKDFYIGRTEVTQAQWKEMMGDNPSSNRKGDTLPVENVSWNDAMEFCERLNEMGKAPTGWKFTLPTETQWEYAARGGNKSKGYKYSGSNDVDEVACTGSLQPVRKKKPNELGLYDMSGNVAEWCLDNWEPDSSKLIAEFTRDNDGGGSFRTCRGGGGSRFCRVAFRSQHYSPDCKTTNLGSRLALVQKQ